MLHYMSGIEISGRKRSSSGGGSKRSPARSQRRQAIKTAKKQALKSFKGGMQQLSKQSPKQALKTARAIYKNQSPLGKMRMKKALKQAQKKAIQIEQGEPFSVELPEEPQGAEFIDQEAQEDQEEGIDEVNDQEFPDEAGNPESEEAGEGMGACFGDEIQIFPSSISGKAGKEKKKAKTSKKNAKADLTKSKGKAKEMKAQAKIDKANKPKADRSGLLDKALDTAGKFGKGGSGEEKAPEESWFAKNKVLVIGGGAVALLGAFMLMKKKK